MKDINAKRSASRFCAPPSHSLVPFVGQRTKEPEQGDCDKLRATLPPTVNEIKLNNYVVCRWVGVLCFFFPIFNQLCSVLKFWGKAYLPLLHLCRSTVWATYIIIWCWAALPPGGCHLNLAHTLTCSVSRAVSHPVSRPTVGQILRDVIVIWLSCYIIPLFHARVCVWGVWGCVGMC